MRKVGFLGVAVAMLAWLGAGAAWADEANVEVSVKGTLPFGRMDFIERVKGGDRAKGGGAKVHVNVVGEPNGAVIVQVGKLRRVQQFERRPRTRQERVTEAKKMALVVLGMVSRAREQMAQAKAAPPPRPAAPAASPSATPAASAGSSFEIKAEGFLPFSRPDFRERVLKALPAAKRPALRVHVHGDTNGAVTVRVGELRRVVTLERRQRRRSERVIEAKKMARIVLDMIARIERAAAERRRQAARRRAHYRSPPKHGSSRAFVLSIQGLFPFSRPDLREQVLGGLPPAESRPPVRVEVKGGQGGKVYIRVEKEQHRSTFERRHRSRRERVAEAKKMAHIILGLIAKATGTTLPRLRAEAKRLWDLKKNPPPPASAPVKPPASPSPAAS